MNGKNPSFLEPGGPRGAVQGGPGGPSNAGGGDDDGEPWGVRAAGGSSRP